MTSGVWFLIRGEDVAERMPDADRGMQIHQRRIARGLSEAIRHAHGDGFLQAEHVAKVVGKAAEHRQLGRARVAEDGGQAEGPQQPENGFAHRDLRLLARRGWRPPSLASSCPRRTGGSSKRRDLAPEGTTGYCQFANKS